MKFKKAAHLYVGRRRVVLFVSIGGTGSAQIWRDCHPTEKNPVSAFVWPEFQPWATWSREIGRELNKQSPWPPDIQEYSVVTARGGDDPPEPKFVEYLRALYAQRPPDLIVALGAPAARFVQRHRADLFPKTPMLIAAIEVRRIDPSKLSEQDPWLG